MQRAKRSPGQNPLSAFWIECRYLNFISSIEETPHPTRLTFLVLLGLLDEHKDLCAPNRKHDLFRAGCIVGEERDTCVNG